MNTITVYTRRYQKRIYKAKSKIDFQSQEKKQMSNDIYPTLMIIYKTKSKIYLQSQEKKQMSDNICPTLMIIYKTKSKIYLQSQEKDV